MKKMKQKSLGLVVLLAAAALIFSACGAAAPEEPTPDPNVVFTQVAETVMVSMTQTSEAMPPTEAPLPTATMAPTQPPAPTVDVQATASAAAVVPTVALAPTSTVQLFGDAAKFNTQSPADGTSFKPNEDFVYHVCLGNIGDTDWDTGFNLKYVDGTKACFDNRTYVGETIEPGGKWCFDLSCKAPESTGTFTTYWDFRDADDNQILVDGLPGVYFTFKVAQ